MIGDKITKNAAYFSYLALSHERFEEIKGGVFSNTFSSVNVARLWPLIKVNINITSISTKYPVKMLQHLFIM